MHATCLYQFQCILEIFITKTQLFAVLQVTICHRFLEIRTIYKSVAQMEKI